MEQRPNQSSPVTGILRKSSFSLRPCDHCHQYCEEAENSHKQDPVNIDQNILIDCQK